LNPLAGDVPDGLRGARAVGRSIQVTVDRRSAFAHAPVGIALTTTDGLLLDVNPRLCELLGRQPDQLIGCALPDLAAPDGAAAAREGLARLSAHRDRPIRMETRLMRADGVGVQVQISASWAEEPWVDPAHLVVVVEDVTERKAREAELVHRSLHDPLTGLPNRLLFQDRLWHALERGRREQTPTCVLIVDLDGFKAINDRLGHPMGDLVLMAFAERLRSVLRASDTAARLGGDEFSIVCENTERSDAEILSGRLRLAVTDPMSLAGEVVAVGVSIGIGHAPGGESPDTSVERVVREADGAMYNDKRRGRR
jgi:diguanylate cyclase (GGDEF)-like protein/PAS domain S-box-containing protein